MRCIGGGGGGNLVMQAKHTAVSKRKTQEWWLYLVGVALRRVKGRTPCTTGGRLCALSAPV